MNRWKKVAAVATALLVIGGAGVAYGQALDANADTLPPTTVRALGAGTTESDFVGMAPCRLVDTRLAGGKLTPGVSRAFDVRGAGASFAAQGGKAGGCAIPAATSVEITVTAVDAANGFLRVFPAGTPPNASFMGYDDAFNVSNTGTVALCNGICLLNQDLKVQAANGATHLVIDVQGYYTSPMAAVVQADGGIDRSSRVVAVEKTGTGTYKVEFDRSILDCAYVGGVGGSSGGDPSGWAIFSDATGSPTKVFVHTRDASGASANRDFHLEVVC